MGRQVAAYRMIAESVSGGVSGIIFYYFSHV